MRPHYRVQERIRGGNLGAIYAVLRTGPRGGTRLVSVWDNKVVANRICSTLNSYSGEEVTGR